MKLSSQQIAQRNSNLKIKRRSIGERMGSYEMNSSANGYTNNNITSKIYSEKGSPKLLNSAILQP